RPKASRRPSSRPRRSRLRAMSSPTRSTPPSARSTRRSSLRSARIGVVGATGAVGAVTLDLLGERGYENVRVFASARSAGRQLGPGTVEEATPDALARGDIDLFLFSVGASASED